LLLIATSPNSPTEDSPSQFQSLLLKVAFTRARSEAEMDYGLSLKDSNGFLPSKKIFNRFSLGEKLV
ncbi:hypothetical protein KK471_29480, partial [Klebsiella pneumoniae]|uniref:hypothetical protein n=1 Tax=Klebsiella pneumoniae TaxID=573 RepID=UPI001BDFA59F